jgi:hypothetical protein
MAIILKKWQNLENLELKCRNAKKLKCGNRKENRTKLESETTIRQETVLPN